MDDITPFLWMIFLIFGGFIALLVLVSFVGALRRHLIDEEQVEIRRARLRDARMKRKLGLKEEHEEDRYWSPD